MVQEPRESDHTPGCPADSNAAPTAPSPAPRRARSRLRKAVSRYTGYVVLRALHAVVCRLPLPVGRALARAVGTATYYASGRTRRLALSNLEAALGDERSPAELRAIARQVFRNMALMAVEWAILRRWSRERLERAFPEVLEPVERLQDDVRAHGSGGIGLTAHIGNWEVLALFYGRHRPGFLVPIANPLYFKKYQDFFHEMRTGCGVEVIYSDEAARKVIRAVRDGSLPSFLIDADVRTNSGVFVEFFGRPTYTVTFPFQIARKLDVPYVTALLLRDGKKFRMVYTGPKKVQRTGDAEADVVRAAQAWSRDLEAEIRKEPAQWAWVQPRWRSTPESPRRRAGHVSRERERR